MPSLIMFVRERLEEDEEAARRVFGTKVMADLRRGVPPPQWVLLEDGSIRDDVVGGGPIRVGFTWRTEADHILRHQPARVLRQTAALRSVVEEHEGRHSCGVLESDDDDPCPTLRHLAAVWDDHPDFPELT